MRYVVPIIRATAMLSVMIFMAQYTISAASCPCDIYAAGGTPCVAAHSTVRALYSAYNGPLYQVRRTSDNQLKEIGVLTPGGYANAAVQDSFLAGKAGTISKIYDQSTNHNDLTKAPGGGFPTACLEASLTVADAKINVNGHTVYGVYTTGAFEPSAGVGYRNNAAKGTATGNNAEGMYMVCSGKHYVSTCCFDYGNAQTNSRDNGNATMETIFFGNSKQWGYGSGTGPWVMNDCENGIQAGVDPNGTKGVWAGNTTIIADYVIGTLKSPKDSNSWTLKGGDATTGKLKTMYSGRQYPGWYPKKLEGAIILGIGGDNSHTGAGTFFEGAMTAAYPPDSTEDAIQANVIAAGYGKTTTSTVDGAPDVITASPFKAGCFLSKSNAVVRLDMYQLVPRGDLDIRLFDLTGRLTATLFKGRPPSRHLTLSLDAKATQPGAYVLKASLNNTTILTKTIALW